MNDDPRDPAHRRPLRVAGLRRGRLRARTMAATVTARDDYPLLKMQASRGTFKTEAGTALDEIDNLRGENKDLRSQADAWADSAADANRSAVKAWVRVHIAEQETEQLKGTSCG